MGIPQVVTTAIIGDGYASAQIFSGAFAHNEDLDDYIRDLLETRQLVGPIDAGRIRFHPVAGSIRSIKQIPNAPAVAQPVQQNILQNLPIHMDLGRRLTPDVRRELEDDFRTRYPAELLLPAETPSDQLLQALLTMVHHRHLEPLSWKRILSLEAQWTVKEQRNSSSKERTLVSLIAQSQGLDFDELEDLSSSPWRISQLLATRSLGFALVRVGHLASWRLYGSKFMSNYTKRQASNLGFRQPSLQEAEEADRLALREIFRVHTEGALIDDAIFEIAVTRDCFSMSLQPRLAIPKQLQVINQGKGQFGKGKRYHKEFSPYKGPQYRGNKGNGKGGKSNYSKGDYKGDYKGGKGGKSRDTTSGNSASGLCNRFQNGNCHDSSCRYKHACSRCGSKAHGSSKCVRS